MVASYGGRYSNNYGFGKKTDLKLIGTITSTTNTNSTTTTNTKSRSKSKFKNIPNTKTIRISEELYQRLVEHSRKQRYNSETYNFIISNLLDNSITLKNILKKKKKIRIIIFI